MDFKTILSLITLLSFHVASLESLPTFGDEFVHIKVHVPKDVANSHGHLKSTYLGSPQYPHVSHKVIHHYHRRRKPSKKSTPIRSVILAEYDKPHAEETDQTFEETFVVKKVQPEQKVSTFKVIEESVQKPLHSGYKAEKTSSKYKNNDHEESFRIVDISDHQKHGYGYTDESDVESVKLVEEKKNYRYLHKVEDSHAVEYTNQKPRKETIKVIESKPSGQYHHHHHHDHHYETHASDESQHYHYKTPHVESVEIIKTKKSATHEPHSKYFENVESEDHNPKGYHKETIEIIKTKSSPKYHHSAEYVSQDRHDLKPESAESIEVEKDIVYTKPRESVKPSYGYSSSKDVKPVIEEQIEYARPSARYKEQDQDYEKSSVIYGEYESSRNPSSTRAKHDVYGNKEDLESDYHHYSAVATDNRSNSGTEKYKSSNRHKTSSSYSSSYETGPQTFQTKDSKFESSAKYQEPTYNPHDDLYDELLPAIVKKPQLNSNIDWPEGVRKPHATETYKGHDSYSVGHVQGVDSGGYHYSS